jgi:hypothetical protein
MKKTLFTLLIGGFCVLQAMEDQVAADPKVHLVLRWAGSSAPPAAVLPRVLSVSDHPVSPLADLVTDKATTAELIPAPLPVSDVVVAPRIVEIDGKKYLIDQLGTHEIVSKPQTVAADAATVPTASTAEPAEAKAEDSAADPLSNLADQVQRGAADTSTRVTGFLEKAGNQINNGELERAVHKSGKQAEGFLKKVFGRRK